MTYFLSELQIEDHFKALRCYLCMADGDFAEILCDLIIICLYLYRISLVNESIVTYFLSEL